MVSVINLDPQGQTKNWRTGNLTLALLLGSDTVETIKVRPKSVTQEFKTKLSVGSQYEVKVIHVANNQMTCKNISGKLRIDKDYSHITTIQCARTFKLAKQGVSPKFIQSEAKKPANAKKENVVQKDLPLNSLCFLSKVEFENIGKQDFGGCELERKTESNRQKLIASVKNLNTVTNPKGKVRCGTQCITLSDIAVSTLAENSLKLTDVRAEVYGPIYEESPKNRIWQKTISKIEPKSGYFPILCGLTQFASTREQNSMSLCHLARTRSGFVELIAYSEKQSKQEPYRRISCTARCLFVKIGIARVNGFFKNPFQVQYKAPTNDKPKPSPKLKNQELTPCSITNLTLWKGNGNARTSCTITTNYPFLTAFSNQPNIPIECRGECIK